MIAIILTAFLSSYAILIAVLITGSLRVLPRPARQAAHQLPGVSIVIPFRNEAENLPGLLSSLAVQDYKGPIELLLVNDNSTDHYSAALQAGRTHCPFPVNVIDSNFDSTRKLTSKQQALDTGISAASHPLIALTDADMVLDPGWISSLVEASPGMGLVFGHTDTIRVRDTPFERLQAFQLEFLFSVAHAFQKTGITGSSMGNNMLLTKAAYTTIGGMKGIGYSIVEDRDLFSAVRKHGIRTAMPDPFVARAHTFACASVSQFFNQMRRWASGGITPRSNLLPVSLIFSIEIIALGFIALLPQTPAIIAGVNFFLTWAFLAISFHRMRSRVNPLLFPVFYLFLLLQTITIGPSLFFKPKIVWKERNLST